MKTVLTSNDHQAIKEAAEKLPTVQRHVRRVMSGESLIELGYDTWDHKPIDPARKYVVDKVLQCNWRVVLTRICENEGAEILHFALDRMTNGTIEITANGTLEFINANHLRKAS